jgi:hypothetical protein
MRLLQFLFLLELLNLTSLAFDLPFVGSNLALEMMLDNLVVLEFVADDTAGERTQATADSGTRAGMTDGGADDRARACSQRTTTQDPLFTGC